MVALRRSALCACVLLVVRVLRACGTQWPFSLSTWSLWRACWPRLVAPCLVWSEHSLFAGWCLPLPSCHPLQGALLPWSYWVAAWGTWRLAENRAHGACRWPPAAEALGSLRVAPPSRPFMGKGRTTASCLMSTAWPAPTSTRCIPATLHVPSCRAQTPRPSNGTQRRSSTSDPCAPFPMRSTWPTAGVGLPRALSHFPVHAYPPL